MTVHKQVSEEYKRGPIQFLINSITLIGIIITIVISFTNSIVFKKPFTDLCIKVDSFMDVQAKENKAVNDSLLFNAMRHAEMAKNINAIYYKQEDLEKSLWRNKFK
jgi:hypothetical protein